jgi:hypothetical protein
MTIKEKIIHIVQSNYKELKGSNEAEMNIADDIQDLIVEIINELHKKEKLKEFIENL